MDGARTTAATQPATRRHTEGRCVQLCYYLPRDHFSQWRLLRGEYGSFTARYVACHGCILCQIGSLWDYIGKNVIHIKFLMWLSTCKLLLFLKIACWIFSGNSSLIIGKWSQLFQYFVLLANINTHTDLDDCLHSVGLKRYLFEIRIDFTTM